MKPESLKIQLLGGFSVRVNDAVIPEAGWRSKRARSLVKLLALAPNQRLQREQVLDALWPDSDFSAAANNLHQTLFSARKIFETAGVAALRLEDGLLSLGEGVGVDAVAFEAAAGRAQGSQDPALLRGVIDLYSGDLLPEDLYEEWTLARRDSLRLLHLNLLLELARLYETHQDYAEGIEALRQVLAFDRAHEEAHLGLMRLYALAGQRQQALRQYQLMKEALQCELSVEPGPAAQRLYEDIQAGRVSSEPGSPVPPETGLPKNQLPSGTVTFLFTDIEGSAGHWEQQPRAMAAAVASHQILLRGAIEANGGLVFKIIGDQVQAAFRLAQEGVQAAAAALQALQAETWPVEIGELRVRMGLHTGPAELEGQDYALSLTLNRAARVTRAGFGGQVLLSREAAELAGRQLPEGAELLDLGEHQLKGLQLPEHLYQLCAPGLGREFPHLASTISRSHNLPAQLTSFVGWETEIGDLGQKIRDQRLVTLTGSGGTGKTRLALEVAGELLDVFPDGVWLVELASLADPFLVPQSVVASLGLVEPPGRTSIGFLTDYLREKQLLLILDNCEHLVEACAELVTGLLHNASRLTILVTSREILGVPGEAAYRIPPLAVPDTFRLPPMEELARYDAVRLFVERAQLIEPGFEIGQENAAPVAEITRQLEGIPLALELAAARLRLLNVSQIALRLNDVFALLSGGSRSVLPRHQTLQALIDWSYNLLTEAERKLLRQLSVFAGGWTLEAAEDVCEGSGVVLNLLGQLTDKSLLLVVPHPGGENRYRMLETVRQYALARQSEAGEAAHARGRHMNYYLRLGETLEPRHRSREQIAALDEAGRELDNIRQALDYGLKMDIQAELRLASALEWFWLLLPHELEGFEWLEKGLESEAFSCGGRPPASAQAMVRAKALTVLGHLLIGMEDPGSVKAKRFLEEALSLYRSSGSEYPSGIAWAFLWSGQSHLKEGNSAEGLPLVKRALDLFRECGNSHVIAECLFSLGDWETDTERQKPIFVEALAIEQANGDIHGIVHAHFSLGVCANLDGEYENALAEFAASREYARVTGNPWKVAFGGLLHSFISHNLGDLERAGRYLDEALARFREIVDKRQVAFCLIWKTLIAFAQGDYPLAAELTDECRMIAHKMGDAGVQAEIYYLRARLARLNGDMTAARRMVEEGLGSRPDLGADRMWLVLELGHLAFQDGDLARAAILWRECMTILLRFNMTHWMIFPLEAMALLALREGRYERAARLFGTRQAVAASHYLSPIELGARETGLAEIQSVLGVERFAQLQAEGKAMTFNLVLALAQEE